MITNPESTAYGPTCRHQVDKSLMKTLDGWCHVLGKPEWSNNIFDFRTEMILSRVCDICEKINEIEADHHHYGIFVGTIETPGTFQA